MTGCWFRGTLLGSETGPATLAMGGALTGVSGRGGGAALHRVGVPSSGPSFSSFSLSTALSWIDCSWIDSTVSDCFIMDAAVHDEARFAASATPSLSTAAWSHSRVGAVRAGHACGPTATAATPCGGAVGLGVGLGAGDGGELGTGDVRGVCARDGGVLGTGTECGSSSKRTRRAGGSAFVAGTLPDGGGDAA